MSLPGRYSVTMKDEYTEDTWPEARWPNFSHKEFVCSHSGLCFLDSEMMDHLQAIRGSFGRGMRITSGYRDATHPIEAKKEKPGSHSTGKAVDVHVRGGDAYRILALAIEHGFTGIGVSQKGGSRFLHLDRIELEDNFHAPRPSLWSY